MIVAGIIAFAISGMWDMARRLRVRHQIHNSMGLRTLKRDLRFSREWREYERSRGRTGNTAYCPIAIAILGVALFALAFVR